MSLDISIISIHAPREGSDPSAPRAGAPVQNFYPRSPRGERQPAHLLEQVGGHFYPRSPRGERPDKKSEVNEAITISIHAPREGSDCVSSAWIGMPTNFYPRSPRGERPYTKGDVTYTEGDFYPRSPRGERRMERSDADTASAFLSTLPARGATLETRYITVKDKFLSTLPARGATP